MNFGKKNIKAILVALLIAAIGTSCAFAAPPEQISDYEIKVVGRTTGEGDYLAVDVYKDGKTASNLISGNYAANKDILFYHDQIAVNADNSFEFVFVMDGPTGYYDLYFGGKNAPTKERFYFVSKTEYDGLILQICQLIAATDKTEEQKKTEFVALIQSKLMNLTFDKYVNEKTNTANAAAYLYGHLCNNSLMAEVEDERRPKLLEYWQRCVATDGVFTGSVSDIVASKTELGIGELKAESFFNDNFVKNGSSLKSTLNTYVKSKNAASIEQFEKDVNDGFILAAAQYPDGEANLKKVLEKYYSGDPDVAPYITLDRCSQIMNVKYDTVALLIEALQKTTVDGGGGGGGGGGSTGSIGSTGSSGSSYDGAIIGGNVDSLPNVSPVPAAFGDIADVPWAQEAIESLFAQRIISGKATGVFAPNDFVTREEIVKMLVEAFYKDYNAQGGSDYSDVDKNAWYYNYVVRAIEKGIVNGYNDEVFGIGDNITREDFCVMVYRILDIKFDNNLSFDDASEISDYAVEAVNALSNMGIINGVGENKFAPKSTATRAEAAKIIYMALNYVKEVAE